MVNDKVYEKFAKTYEVGIGDFETNDDFFEFIEVLKSHDIDLEVGLIKNSTGEVIATSEEVGVSMFLDVVWLAFNNLLERV